MDLLKSYILPRILQWFIVVFVGVSVTFIIPRLLPSDPVQQTLTRVSSMSFVDPAAIESFRATLEDLYGLSGTLPEQYLAFWQRTLRGDLGPSLNAFPTPVITIIKTGLPWTIGLLTTTILLSWILGIVLGTVAGYFPRNPITQTYDKVLITVYPIPYFVLALILVMVFSYYLPIFPSCPPFHSSWARPLFAISWPAP